MGSLGRRLAELPWRSSAAAAYSNISLVVKGLCAFQVIHSYLLDFALTTGPSMLPTFNLTGDLLAVNKVPTWWGQLDNGDVVLMRSPENPRKHIVKRVLGVEGEMVTYLVDPANSNTTKTVMVPKGHIWVQGDYIHSSNDSRNFGPVPQGLVEGTIFCRVWPPENFGLIESKVNPYEPPTN